MPTNLTNSPVADDVINLLNRYNISKLQYIEVKDREAINDITARWPLLAQSVVIPNDPDPQQATLTPESMHADIM